MTFEKGFWQMAYDKGGGTGGDTGTGVDLFDPAGSGSLYESLGEARAACPVVHNDRHGGHWMVLGYEAAKEVLTRPDRFSSEGGITLDESPVSGSLIETDPPRHRELRRPLDRYFGAQHLSRYEPFVVETTDRLIGGWIDDGRCDIVAAFAGPLAASVLARVVLGLPDATDAAAILEAAEAVESGAAGVRNEAALRDLILDLITSRRSSDERTDDVLSAIVFGTTAEGPLTEAQVYNTIRLFLGAGQDTTKAAIANAVLRLTTVPHLEPRLRERSLTRGDVDELLRLDSPVVGLCRVAREAVTLEGQPIAKGDKLMVFYGAANRDANRFPDPEQLDLDRADNAHLAFGSGVHRCIGASLARLEIRIAIERLLAQVRDLRRASTAPVVFRPGVIRYPESLVVTFRPS